MVLFVDKCAAHPQDTPCLRNVGVVYYASNCSSVLQPLDLGNVKCFTQLCGKHLVQKCAAPSSQDRMTN
jgi:hypothetical protein